MDGGATRLVSAWIAHLRGHGAPVADARATDVTALVDGTLQEAVTRVLGWLGLDRSELRHVVEGQVREIEALASSTARQATSGN